MNPIIYKYEIFLGHSTIHLPKDCLILDADFQNDRIHIWVLLNPTNPIEPRSFFVALTGQPITYPLTEFLKTIKKDNASFIAHVFEVPNVY